MTSSSISGKGEVMLGLIKSEAAQGDAEAIRTLATLRSMGLIKDEPVEPKETPTWELLDMCCVGSRKRKKEGIIMGHVKEMLMKQPYIGA
jgi:hypothetical protein